VNARASSSVLTGKLSNAGSVGKEYGLPVNMTAKEKRRYRRKEESRLKKAVSDCRQSVCLVLAPCPQVGPGCESVLFFFQSHSGGASRKSTTNKAFAMCVGISCS
jgi:hypothetical protein